MFYEFSKDLVQTFLSAIFLKSSLAKIIQQCVVSPVLGGVFPKNLVFEVFLMIPLFPLQYYRANFHLHLKPYRNFLGHAVLHFLSINRFRLVTVCCPEENSHLLCYKYSIYNSNFLKLWLFNNGSMSELIKVLYRRT